MFSWCRSPCIWALDCTELWGTRWRVVNKQQQEESGAAKSPERWEQCAGETRGVKNWFKNMYLRDSHVAFHSVWSLKVLFQCTAMHMLSHTGRFLLTSKIQAQVGNPFWLRTNLRKPQCFSLVFQLCLPSFFFFNCCLSTAVSIFPPPLTPTPSTLSPTHPLALSTGPLYMLLDNL